MKRCYECLTPMEKWFDEEPNYNDTNWYCPTCKAGTL